MASTPTTMTLKLLVDTRNQRVVVAEAEKDFVDFLFNILTLPLGSIIRLLTKQEMVGSLGTLYGSIENLSDTYLPSKKKENLLKPIVVNPITTPFTPLPKIESITRQPKNYFRCGGSSSGCREYVTVDNPKTACPQCKNSMKCPAKFVPPPSAVLESSSGEGGYVKGVVTYMVMDDLVVKPMSTTSGPALLSSFNVKHVGNLKVNVVTFDRVEALNLLKASLQSKMVLTEIFLRNKKSHPLPYKLHQKTTSFFKPWKEVGKKATVLGHSLCGFVEETS